MNPEERRRAKAAKDRADYDARKMEKARQAGIKARTAEEADQLVRLATCHAMVDDQMVAVVAFGPDRPDCICALPCDLSHFDDDDVDWRVRFGRMPLAAFGALPEHGGW